MDTLEAWTVRKGAIIIGVILLVLISSGCTGGGQTTTEIKATTSPVPTAPPETRIETVTKTTQLPTAPTTTAPTTTAPTTTAPTTTAPTTTPPPKSELKILSTNSYIDILGWTHIVGEVENTGETTLSIIQVTATFYDSAGTVIGTDLSFTSIGTLTPNQKSPFEIINIDEGSSSKIDSYKVQSSYTMTTNAPNRNLEILSHSSNVDVLGWMHVVGEVNNKGDTQANLVEVVATFYNSGGEVVATGFTFTQPTEIPPGGTSPFEIIVTQESIIPQINNYELQVDSN